MKSYILLPAMLVISSAVLAEPTCPAPRDTWMKQAEFKKSMEDQGYKIKTLKITNGCFEIYGYDKSGKKVEMSFDPVTGLVAK